MPNQVASAFLDALSEILVGRNKIIPASLPPAMEVSTECFRLCVVLQYTMLQVIFSNISISCIPLDRLPRLAEEGLIYLHAYNTFSPWHQDFVSCQAVAKMILQAAMQYADLLKTLEVSFNRSTSSAYIENRTWPLPEQCARRPHVEHGPPCSTLP